MRTQRKNHSSPSCHHCAPSCMQTNHSSSHPHLGGPSWKIKTLTVLFSNCPGKPWGKIHFLKHKTQRNNKDRHKSNVNTLQDNGEYGNYLNSHQKAEVTYDILQQFWGFCMLEEPHTPQLTGSCWRSLSLRSQ